MFAGSAVLAASAASSGSVAAPSSVLAATPTIQQASGHWTSRVGSYNVMDDFIIYRVKQFN